MRIQATNISLGRYRPGAVTAIRWISTPESPAAQAQISDCALFQQSGSESICLSFTGDKVTLNDKSAHFWRAVGRCPPVFGSVGRRGFVDAVYDASSFPRLRLISLSCFARLEVRGCSVWKRKIAWRAPKSKTGSGKKSGKPLFMDRVSWTRLFAQTGAEGVFSCRTMRWRCLPGFLSVNVLFGD